MKTKLQSECVEQLYKIFGKFTEMGSPRPIGIVIVEIESSKERKAYIGTGVGVSEERDIDMILNHGAKFHLFTAESIIEKLKGGNNG